MVSKMIKLVWIVLGLAVAGALAFLGLRAYGSQQGDPLEVWHTHVPQEMSVEAMDAGDWAGYLKAEEQIYKDLREEVTAHIKSDDRVPANRYFEGSPVFPGHFTHDWNRSFILMPEGTPRGAAVFLHGLTDSPYSQRHFARRYQEKGFIAVTPRLPGHGTVPAGLTKVTWEEWMAATRLAVREAKRLAGPGKPLHIIGFSNGGALAMKYALDAIDDPTLPRADQIILLSPMIGVTEFARFAGFAGLPAVFPAFAKAAWLAVMPEFNPFKYNSFPTNGALQSFRVTRTLQPRIVQFAKEKRLETLPPILTFQSLIDFTVSTSAIVNALYAHLPQNGSELVLFDLNRHTKFGPLLRVGGDTEISRVLPPLPRNFRTTVVSNADTNSAEVSASVAEAGASTVYSRLLGLDYPSDVFSLSHVALPFPVTDSLYGMKPDSSDEDFGVNLGSMAVRGERGTLVVSLDTLVRMSSNPFFPYIMERVTNKIDESLAGVSQREIQHKQ